MSYSRKTWKYKSLISSSRLNNIEDGIEEALDDSSTALEKAEAVVSQVAANVTASTDSDANYAAEVVDARVGYDSTEYGSLGEAIREQASALNKSVGSLESSLDAQLEDMNEQLAAYGAALEYDEVNKTITLVNADGTQLGDSVTIDSGLAFTYCDYDDEYYLHFYDDEGNDVIDPVYIPGGGGTGSGYTVRLANSTGLLSFNTSSTASTNLYVTYYEYYGQDLTGTDGKLTVTYKKTTETDYSTLISEGSISQGVETAINVTDILEAGSTTTIKVTVTGGESEITKTLTFTIGCVEINLTSTFSDTTAYTSAISFLYRPSGKNLSKTMYFYIDDELYTSVDIGTTHNSNLTQTISLAAYGHGSHKLEAYFLTSDGAQSPVLTYDVMYDAGDSTPIISCSFDTDEVTYGDTITVNYATFTHGSDYTYDVSLSIYYYDNDGNRIDYMTTELESVVNQTTHTWSITDYPESGQIYLEIAAGETVKTFGVYVNELAGDRDIGAVATRLIASYSASGRSNSESKKALMTYAYTSKDDLDTTITGTLSNFNFRSNGWMTDDNGYPVLRVSGDAEVDFDIPFFASSWTDSDGQKIQLAGTPTAAGRTFEVEFATDKVTDYNSEIITVWDGSANVGIKIFPSKAYLLSNSMSLNEDEGGNVLNKNTIPYVPFASDQEDSDGEKKVRLSFVIEQLAYTTDDEGAEKQLIRVYVNGQLAKVAAYSSDSFTSSSAYPYIHAEGCILDIYSMRMYDYALDDAGILKNYIADKPSVSEKITIYDENDIMDDNDDVSLELSITKYTCMVIYGTLSSYKGNKTKVGVRLYKPDGSYDDGYYVEWDYMETLDGVYGNQSNVQGTSSQYYPKKNYKLTFYQLVDGAFKKVKVYIFDDRIPVNTICIKADFMSMDSGNTGNANFWDATLQELTPPQEDDSRVQTCVLGYPILVFQADSEGDTPTFMGRYNLNNDKSNSEAFGLENDDDDGNSTQCQKYEYLDNSEDICNWKTDALFAERTDSDGSTYYAWEDALESTYPDQGDLEDEGLVPDLDRLQMHYSWVCQRANFYEASTASGTGGTYGGVEYGTERELKKAIFIAEFEKHFNLHHFTHYFIANECTLLVDNFSKNFFATMYNKNGLASGTGYQKILDLDGNEITVSSLRATDGTGTMDTSNVDWINSTFDPIYATKYDMDSGLGKDNNGYDQFPYFEEMWDSYNGSQIVNGAGNILWIMFYEAFYDEIKELYCNMRDDAQTLSADQYLETIIDNGVSQLPIVAVNRDERYKYIDPYLEGYMNTETNLWTYTSTYLYLAQSTMESYHRDWVTKRFAMLDSKYLEDSYIADVFNLRVNRGQSDPDDLAFEVAPSQALYCYTEWGNSGTYIGGKCLENETIEMKPSASGNWYDIVLAVYGASHYRSFGDLSPLMASKLQNLSLCTNLTDLILGSEADDYENTMLEGISDIVYLSMLKVLNIGNCTGLTGTIDLSSCDLIEEVYAKGSGISAVSFPEGGYLKKVHLPAGITTLSVVDHTAITEFTMEGYSSVTSLRVENSPNVPTADILLGRGTALTRLRLEGVEWELGDDETLLELLADGSWAGKAIDATGAEVDDDTTYPTITGTATADSIHGATYDTLAERYPDLTITYGTKYHTVTFIGWDGETVSTQTVSDGSRATTPEIETAHYTEQYIYTFRGWDTAYTNVTSDLTVTATWSSVLQSYTVEFYADEGDTEAIATVSGIGYGSDYEYPNDLPTKDGYIFTGWADSDGNSYEYVTMFPDAAASIDSDGNPITIKMYGQWSVIEFPSTSKSFDQLTDGERKFCEMAIQDGEADGLTVTYYEDTDEYILTDTETLAVVSLAVGDTKQWTLYNGETMTQRILDFNHDYGDEDETVLLGITYDMENCLTSTRQMNPSYKHCFDFQIGSDDEVVSDTANHSSTTDSALTHTHTASASEASAGHVEIDILGQTYLDSIQVAHSDGTTETWHFNNNGYYIGEDSDSISQNSWYKSDTDTDSDNPFYKIGKMLQEHGCQIYNVSTTECDSWAGAQQARAMVTGEAAEFTDFGGLVVDTTGADTFNTADTNPTDGNGVARMEFHADYGNNWNNFTEFSEGCVIKVPVVSGDVVTVKAYGQSRNWGGWDNSSMQAWANGTFPKQLPIGLFSTIVPALKKASVGNRSRTIQKGLYTFFGFSYNELGGNSTNTTYTAEGTQYPIYTSNANRIKYLANGESSAPNWWGRSPNVYTSNYFCGVTSGGSVTGGNHAYYSYGVSLGFCGGYLPS